MTSATSHCVQKLLQSIDSAIDGLARPGLISDENAHEVRKALKKARAALRLLRPMTGDLVYRRENLALRNASRSVSRLRDAKAQLDIIAVLRKRHPTRMESAWIALESQADRRLERLRKRLQGTSPPVLTARRLIGASKARLSTLKVRAGAAKDLNASLRKIYRSAYKAFAIAQQHPSTISLHEWRKKEKYFANAVDALGEHATSRDVARARDVVRLGDWLGEEHDLAGLADALLRDHRILTSGGKAMLRKAADARRAKLRTKALHAGEKLHAKSPKHVVK
jgi:CHAD domain-containing protein